MKNLKHYVAIYQEQLDKGEIQIAYAALVKFVMNLKTEFSKSSAQQYSFGNILQGYMDYTYFYFSNDFLKSKKLKYGIVLNHQKMRFEIWLLGSTADVQRKYWNILKTSKWNADRTEMPKYSILEAVLVENPDFDNLNLLSKKIEKNFIKTADEIMDELKRDEKITGTCHG